MTIKSNAKINFGLRIINRRDDGFHNIETVFYPIDLFDEIQISLTPAEKDCNTVIISIDKFYVPSNKNNICYKVIESFFNKFRISDFHKIELHIYKNIPVGGGLGGGSSNAAAVLRYLIKYFNIDINEHRQEILDVATAAGSDVPFFLIGKPCVATGKGDELKLIPDFKIDYKILLVNPNVSVSTKWAYENIQLKENVFRKTPLSEVKEFNIKDPMVFKNDFEDVVFMKFPELKQVKNYMLGNGATFVSMSGSGATMFGLFKKNKRPMYSKCIRHFNSLKYFVRLL